MFIQYRVIHVYWLCLQCHMLHMVYQPVYHDNIHNRWFLPMPALGCHKGYLCVGERYTCIKLHDCCCSISLTGGCVFVVLIGLLLVCWLWHAGLSVCVYMYRSPGHSRFHRQPTPRQPRTFLCAYSACRWLHLVYANRVSGQTLNLTRFRLQGTLNSIS